MGREELGINDRRWCILRTSGRATLGLAASLREDGFEVWTPIETKMTTKARFNVKREARLPLLAGFIFARCHHLFALLEVAAFPTRRGPGGRMPAHDSFSVFRSADGIPLVDDRALEPLRSAEKRRAPRHRQRIYGTGASVRVAEGSYEGMVGKVESCKNGKAVIFFGGSSPFSHVEIPTSILRDDEVRALRGDTGAIAIAA